MRKWFVVFSLAVAVFVGCHLYGTRAEVVERLDGAIGVEDTDGEVWLMDDDGALSVGDSVIMIMNNNGTASIYDDEIVIIHKVA